MKSKDLNKSENVNVEYKDSESVDDWEVLATDKDKNRVRNIKNLQNKMNQK